MGFVAECIEQNLATWEACLNSEFLTRLETGELSEDCFQGYIVEDTLYLREYAKVFAWGITKATDMDTIRVYYALMSFVNDGEGGTRRQYLKRYQLPDEFVEYLPLRPANQAYTDCMIQAAKEGEGAPECMMACLPCILSYRWIFQKILDRTPSVKETVYWPLVRDYVSETYADSCKRWTEYTDKICADLPEERRQHCMDIFRACSEYELDFWKICIEPREDLPHYQG